MTVSTLSLPLRAALIALYIGRFEDGWWRILVGGAFTVIAIVESYQWLHGRRRARKTAT